MLLEVMEVDAYYGESQALHGASIQVEEGSQVGIIGRNGMGKTTLIHVIMGMLRVRQGWIRLDGRDVTGKSPEAIAEAGITLVPQGRRVFKSLTVGENLEVAVRERGDDAWTIAEVCDRLPVLSERWNQMAGSLSGGQKQMLALGRAIVGNGRLMLLDEPSEGLDQHNLALLVETVRELERRGTAIVLVEQKLRFAMDLVEVVHVMVRGQLRVTLSAEDVRKDPTAILQDLGFGERTATGSDI